jgi:hypothetical protein
LAARAASVPAEESWFESRTGNSRFFLPSLPLTELSNVPHVAAFKKNNIILLGFPEVGLKPLYRIDGFSDLYVDSASGLSVQSHHLKTNN